MRDVMIMLAPNGARRDKTDCRALPLTVSELVAAVVPCATAGVCAVHLHVRDAEGHHSLDPGLYREAIDALRKSLPDIVIQVTTEAVGRYTPAEQMAVVRALRPEAVSLALRELVPDPAAEPAARAFFAWLAETRIAPQFILYAPEEVTRLLDLVDRGIIPFARPFLLFVLGRYSADQQSSPTDLAPFVAALGSHCFPWAMCAFGRREADCALAAARLGGHVRIGFENNLHLPDGTPAPDNAALVAATAALLRAAGFGIMAPEPARRLMGVGGS
jgi:3-keto-5-aminohexanoate cleavage enzyme